MAAIGQTDNDVNEIQQFVDSRYISAPESCWRIYHYNMHDRSPSIQCLAIHLPDQQNVIYSTGHAQEALNSVNDTTLTAWLKTNSDDPDARNVHYHQFPEKYVWEQKSHSWRARKRGNTIGRVYRANPIEGERFYLRLLLHHVTGCTSFQDVRTLSDGTICPTFKEAAIQRGLLLDDSEWTLSAGSCLIRYPFPT